MKTLVYQIVVFIMVVSIAGMAHAYPSKGGNCTACHGGPAGEMDITANPISVNSDGVVTFDVTTLPGANNRIVLENLEAVGLDATVGIGWVWSEGSFGQGYMSDNIDTVGRYALDLVIGASAIQGMYDITAYLVGDGPAGVSYDFSVSVIPEPGTLALAGLGLIGIVASRRRR